MAEKEAEGRLKLKLEGAADAIAPLQQILSLLQQISREASNVSGIMPAMSKHQAGGSPMVGSTMDLPQSTASLVSTSSAVHSLPYTQGDRTVASHHQHPGGQLVPMHQPRVSSSTYHDTSPSYSGSGMPFTSQIPAAGGLPGYGFRPHVPGSIPGGPVPAGQSPSGKLGVFGDILGAETVLRSSQEFARDTLGMAGRASTGQYTHPSLMLPSAIGLAGAGIGMALGGPPGAFAGGMVASGANAFITPAIEAGVGISEADIIMRARFGDRTISDIASKGNWTMEEGASPRMSKEAARAYAEIRRRGHVMSTAFIESILPNGTDLFMDNGGLAAPLQADFMKAIDEARYSTDAILKYGVPGRRGAKDPSVADVLRTSMTPDNALNSLTTANTDARRLMSKNTYFRGWNADDRITDVTSGWSDPSKRAGIQKTLSDAMGAKAAGEVIKDLTMASDADETVKLMQKLNAQNKLFSATLGVADIGLRDFWGSAAEYGAKSSVALTQIERMRNAKKDELDDYDKKHPGQDPATSAVRQGLVTDLRSLEEAMHQKQAGRASKQFEESSAFASRDVTTASLGVQTAIYGGKSAADTPYGALKAGHTSMVSALTQLRDNPESHLTPAQKANLDAQIAQEQYQATIGVGLAQRQQKIGELQGQGALNIASYAASQAGTIATKSITESTAASYAVKKQQLDEELSIERQILNLKEGMTEQEKLQHEARIKNIEAAKVQLKVDTAFANAVVGIQIAAANHIESGASATMALMRGAGGRDAQAAQGESYSAAQDRTRAAIKADSKYRAELEAQGMPYDKDSDKAIQLRQQIASAQVAELEAFHALAITPKSAGMRIAEGGARAEYAIKQNLTGGETLPEVQKLIASNSRYRGELDDNRKARMAQGQWDDESERRYQEAYQNLRVESAQLKMQTVIPVTPVSERIALSDVEARRQVASLTYAGEGDIRGMITQEMGLVKSQMTRLNQRKNELEKSGDMEGLMKLNYTEEKNKLVVQGAQLQRQLEEGWQDRLISEAFNTPGNGRMVMSQFTHRESAMFQGIYSQAFGGTGEQMGYARQGYHRFFGRDLGQDAAAGGVDGGRWRTDVDGSGKSVVGAEATHGKAMRAVKSDDHETKELSKALGDFIKGLKGAKLKIVVEDSKGNPLRQTDIALNQDPTRAAADAKATATSRSR